METMKIEDGVSMICRDLLPMGFSHHSLPKLALATEVESIQISLDATSLQAKQTWLELETTSESLTSPGSFHFPYHLTLNIGKNEKKSPGVFFKKGPGPVIV